MWNKIIDHLCVVLAAILFLQIPLLIQQYQLQLSGRVAELQWQVDAMRQAATQTSKSLEQYIEKFVKNNDEDIVRQGEVMHRVKQRWTRLSTGLNALETSSLLTRPLVFVYYLQYDVLKATFSIFALGIPFTFEGIIYGMIGMAFGYGLSRLLVSFGATFKKRSV